MKNCKKILALALVMALALMLTACSSKESKYEGTYLGNQGSTLILRSDGECTYQEATWDKARDGTWEIEDDVLTISNVERREYGMYVRLEGDSTTLLLEAYTDTWRDELFVKAD